MSSSPLVVVVLAPGVVSLLVVLAGRGTPRVAGIVATASTAVLFACTVALTTVGADARAGWFGLLADRIGVLLLLLVFGVSALAQGFAVRYLSGDARRIWFIAATGLLTSGSAALVTAATLLTAATAWTVTGMGLWLLLRTYAHLPSARDGAARALRAFAVGDGALWLAVAVASVRWGSVDLRPGAFAPAADDRGWAAVVTGLLVVAALTRCAQVPWHRWLPVTLAAPTPVSALLHAGVVNGGGVLLVRLSPVTDAAPAVLLLAVTAGAASLVYGTTMMLIRPDIKGSLAYSTVGQMGFMLMTAGLGWHAITVFHIVAHGLYKAALFLGSGSAVRRHIGDLGVARVPVTTGRSVALGGFAAMTMAAAVAGAEAWRPYPGARVVAVFVWATATALCWGWLRRTRTLPAAIGVVAGGVVATFAYVALVHTVTTYLDLSDRSSPASGVVLAAVVVALATVGLLRHRTDGRLGAWQKTLYVTLLASDLPGRRRLNRRDRNEIDVRPIPTAEPIAVGAAS